MIRTVHIDLNEQEEEMLSKLAQIMSNESREVTPEEAFDGALLIGRKWEAYVFDKIVDAMWQLGGKTYEEAQKYKQDYKKQIEEQWENRKSHQLEKVELEPIEDALEP